MTNAKPSGDRRGGSPMKSRPLEGCLSFGSLDCKGRHRLWVQVVLAKATQG